MRRFAEARPMEKLDKKTFMIGVLTLSAVILFVANLYMPHPAKADLVVKDRDYQAVTARTFKGGDALYLTDNRQGLVAVLMYDPNKKQVIPMTVVPIGGAFANGNAPVPPRKGK